MVAICALVNPDSYIPTYEETYSTCIGKICDSLVYNLTGLLTIYHAVQMQLANVLPLHILKYM